MLNLGLPFIAVVLAGLGIALETPTNALLMRTLHSAVVASLVSFCIGGIVLAFAAGVMRPKLTAGAFASVPWYAWTGGLLGAVVVLASAWATPKLGAGTTLVAIVAAQVALGVFLDNIGALGLERHAASWPRLLGVGVVFIGAVMVGRF